MIRKEKEDTTTRKEGLSSGGGFDKGLHLKRGWGRGRGDSQEMLNLVRKRGNLSLRRGRKGKLKQKGGSKNSTLPPYAI